MQKVVTAHLVNADAELTAGEPHCPLMMFPHSLTFTLPSKLIILVAHLHHIQKTRQLFNVLIAFYGTSSIDCHKERQISDYNKYLVATNNY